MKFLLAFLSLLITVILAQGNGDFSSVLHSTDEPCATWSFYNHSNKRCECYSNAHADNIIVKCTEDSVLLRLGYCMTYKEGSGFYVGECKMYFDLSKYNVSDTVYFIRLPRNVSELNAYMCAPLNREGNMCGQCIEGYGPSITSVTSVRNQCEKCPEARCLGGYLILELLQVVVIYGLILILRIKYTSSPLIVLVLYCQLQELAFLRASNTIHNSNISTLWEVQVTILGIINLDIVRYIIPAFCVSPRLRVFETAYLNYIPFIYLLLMLLFTWICIKFHSRNVRPIVWLWNKLNGLVIHINATWDTIIDAFVTVFLLSYANLAFTSNLIFAALSPTVTWNANNFSVIEDLRVHLDPSIHFFTGEHRAFVIFSFLIGFFVVLPLPILLALYPIKRFRSLLFRSPIIGRRMGTINTFLDKFYCCYRDGLDGGRDMRSFVSLYYFVHLLFFSLIFTGLPLPECVDVNVSDVLFTVMSILVAIVRPYKKTYMNIADTLILAHLGLFFHLLDACQEQNTFSSSETCYILLSLLNLIVPLAMIIAIGYRIFVLLRKSQCWYRNIRANIDKEDSELVEPASFNTVDAHEHHDHLLQSEKLDQDSNYGSTEQSLV